MIDDKSSDQAWDDYIKSVRNIIDLTVVENEEKEDEEE